MTGAAAAPEPTDGALALRVARTYLRPRRAGIATAALCAALVAAFAALFALAFQAALDGITNPGVRALYVMPLAIIGLAFGRAVVMLLQVRLISQIGHGVVGDIQRDLFSHLIRSDLQRLQAVHSGSLVSSMLFDTTLMREAATTGLITGAQHLLTIIGMVAVLFYFDPLLALFALVAGPLSSIVLGTFRRKTQRAAKNAMAETSALSTAIMESLDGVKIVKIESRESYEEQRVNAVISRRQRQLIKGSNARSSSAPMTEFMMAFVIAGILAYAGWRAAQGQMTVGAFTAFMVALMTAGQSLRQLAGVNTMFAEGLSAARRVFSVMDIAPQIVERPGAKPLPDGASHVRLEDVSFAYGPEARALENVTLEARRGETVALVGPSGGGKTTVLNLIPRFFEATSGAVTIDGQDIRDVSLDSLRAQIAFVTQEPFLFDESIRANIAYAKPDATDEEIEAAARQAAAHDFITALPEGYGAMAGEAGVRLSGGQRQRIAIARAFLKNAPILLLDEATSALDTESEAQVQAALERLMSGRTTILIAHRLSTVQAADRIYVIDQGRVVETGDHKALVREGGLYARLAAAQNLELVGARSSPEAAE